MFNLRSLCHIVVTMRWLLCVGAVAIAGSALLACGSSGDATVDDGDAGDRGDAGAEDATKTLDAQVDHAPGDSGNALDATVGDAPTPSDADTDASSLGDGATHDGASGADATGAPDGGDASTASLIKHVVLVVQENHTFDAYFGAYCTAPAGSSPTCNVGPACCEAAPATEPSGASPKTLDDTLNAGHDPSHAQSCELSEMHGGLMDRYVSGGTGTGCSDARNFAVAPASVVQRYYDYASKYAIADRYFQPLAGASSANDMYFAAASYVFTDNAYEPLASGHGCGTAAFVGTIKYTGKTTIADVLLNAGFGFGTYVQGYKAMVSTPLCPSAPSDCPAHLPSLPCIYDPADIPFEYYGQFTDDPKYMKDYDADFAKDVANHALPSFSYLKALQYHDEHPGYGTTISDGITWVKGVVDTIQGSTEYKDNTLVLIVWDEGGGFFDHVAPPGTSTVDNQPYGTRVPILAIGPFAKTNYVSHVVMEHSSVVKFLEYNFLGKTGQLAGRDAVVNNIGSLLDPQKIGITIPEN